MTDGEAARGPAAFGALGASVRDALSARGFETPTEPQRRAIPPLVAGEHGLVVAPTGSGKTETAMLPVLDALYGPEQFGIGALYVTPLRALNRDMRERLDWWGDRLDLEIDVRHGDTTDYRRQQQAEDPPDVLVTTPETLQAILTGKRLRRALEAVEHVVVDEIHELATSKRGAQLTVGLERLGELAGPYQRIGLSATVGDPGEIGRFLTGDRGCEVVEVDVGSNLDIDVRTPDVTAADETLANELVTSGGRQPRPDDRRDRHRQRGDTRLRQHPPDCRGARLAAEGTRHRPRYPPRFAGDGGPHRGRVGVQAG
jgi:ATP-dependent Lhr-like helicase